MINILRVWRYEFLRGFRRKSYLFTTFLLPLIGLVAALVISNLFGSFNEQVEPESLMEQLVFDTSSVSGFVDHSGLFADTPLPDHLIRLPDEAAAEEALQNETVSAVYILPEDYAKSGEVRLLVNNLQIAQTTGQPVTQLIFSELGDSVDQATLLRLRFPANFNDINLTLANAPADDNGVTRTQETDFWLVYVFGIVFIFTIFATSGYLLQSVIEEKESRLVEILISTIRPRHLLAGKVLANGVLGVLQIGAWLALGIVILSQQAFVTDLVNLVLSTVNASFGLVVLLVVYFVLGYLSFAAFFGGVGAVSNSLREGPQLTILVVLPALVPFFLIDTFTANPNDPWAVVLSLFPITSPLAMPMRLLLTEVSPLEIGVSIALLIGLVWGMFWLAGRLFRVQTLLAGNAPKVWQLPRLIFARD